MTCSYASSITSTHGCVTQCFHTCWLHTVSLEYQQRAFLPTAVWDRVPLLSVPLSSFPTTPSYIRLRFMKNQTKCCIKWKPSSHMLIPIPPLSFFHLLPRLLGAMVICPLRGGESVTCRLAPSSYDTRWHSTAVISSTKPGSGDQIISHPASISHILMCHSENRSHAIRMKPTEWPTSPLSAISTTCVRERLRSDLR